jgi:hypothetical protein
MSKPLFWCHRHKRSLRGWLVRRRVRRVRAELERVRTRESPHPSHDGLERGLVRR